MTISLDEFNEVSLDSFEEEKPAQNLPAVPGRKHLSHSQISTYSRCPLVYYWRYVKGVSTPPAANMALGSSLHKAFEENYKQKIMSHKDLPLKTVLDIFRDSWGNNAQEAVFDSEKGESHDGMLSDGLMMVEKYQKEVAPNIQPKFVESRFLIQVPGVEREVLGFIDLIDDSETVIDHKTSKATPNALNLAKDFQLVLYRMAYRIRFGRNPNGLRYDYLVRKSSRKTGNWVEVHPMPVEKNDAHEAAMIEHFKTIEKGIKMAFFHQPDVYSFICTPTGCGYWNQCQGRIQRGEKPEFLDEIREMQCAAAKRVAETGEI